MSSVKGLKELDRKLAALGAKAGGKILRSAALQASTPAMRRMKATAPRGRQAHRTYKGNLVAPGFLSRSIKRKGKFRNGTARVMIGVKKEAHYGLTYVERGTKPHRIPKRGTARLKFGGGVFSSVNHPGARPKPWFERAFVRSKDEMVDKMSATLRKKILQVVK